MRLTFRALLCRLAPQGRRLQAPALLFGLASALGLGALGCDAGGTGSQATPADVIFTNATVWTLNPDQPVAEALAIQDGKFLAVGTNAQVLEHETSTSEVLDLRGAFVVPGFNDNHVHFASAAQFLEFNIMTVESQDELVARVKDVTARIPEGDWIVGGFWGAYDQWALGSSGADAAEGEAGFTPDMERVAALTAAHPVFLRKFDDSEFAVNRLALEAAGLDPEGASGARSGIEMVRDSEGGFTGILRGAGVMERFRPLIPPPSHERRRNQTLRALAEIRRYGVTNVSDMSDDEQLALYRELREAGELTVRVHFRYPLDRWSELAEKGIAVGSGDEWIRLGGLKGHIDGIMGSSTARFFEPYEHDPTNRGRWRRLMVDDDGQLVEGKFLQYMLDSDAAGLQLTVHAIGDEANHLLLDYLDALDKTNGPQDRRFRLVHAQVIARDDFPRFANRGIVAEVQPFHLSDDMRWMEERIGADRCRGAYAFRSLQDHGAILSFGTDWPGTAAAEYPINPMLGLYAAVTRQTVNGEPEPGWFPDERISMEDALRAYTLGTAYANFEEDIKGSIEVGKLADLAVLSQNLLEIPPAKILETEVLSTWVGGQRVYERR